MTVAMALAEQPHHSVNRVERDEALRRQTTRASEEEEEVHKLYDGLRAQKRPPRGGAAGSPAGARAAEERPQPAALRDGWPPDPWPAGTGWGVGGGS